MSEFQMHEWSASPTPSGRPAWLKPVLIVGAVALLVVLYLVGKASEGGSTSTGPNFAGWHTSVTKTKCTQWTGQMTGEQQFVMASALVHALGAKDTSNSFSRGFQADITQACRPGLDTVGDTAAALATLDAQDFSPK